MKEVYNFIYSLGIKDCNIVVAVSGGPDSMLLLNILLDLRKKLNLNIVVSHVHHNLRKESDDEAIKLKKYCEENNIIFEMKKIEEYPNNKFSEQAARKIRYDFFDEVIKKYNSDILFTAHHGDDLIETILMRLTRGSTLKGYAGFERLSTDRGYKIAKPLIFLTKDEIKQYLDEKKVWYATDLSNESEKYTRNRFRKNILPELKKENKDVHNKFIEYNEKILFAHQYIKKQLDKVYTDIVVSDQINIKLFSELDDILKIYLLEEYLKEIYKDNILNINYTHINIIKDVLSKKNNCIIDLPYNKIGILEYNIFKVVDKMSEDNYNYTFYDNIVLPNGKKILIDNNTLLTSNYVIHLNSKEIKLPFHVRNMKQGDKMTIKNMEGSKKVSDIFTDFKLPKELRGNYPIVTDDTDTIIWIPGIKKSKFDRKKTKKYDIILKYD